MLGAKRKLDAVDGVGVISVARCARGARRPEPRENTMVLDVTVGNAKRRGFQPVEVDGKQFRPYLCSPMVLGPVAGPWRNGKGVTNLEIFWQFGKRWRAQDDEEWSRFNAAGYEQDFDCLRDKPLSIRHPKEGKPVSSQYFGLNMGYILSRKVVYVLLYTRLLLASEEFGRIARLCAEQPSLNITLLDFDGPTVKVFKDELTNASLAVTKTTWQKAVNHTGLRFGHGFVMAALLAGLMPADYSQLTASDHVAYRQAVNDAVCLQRAWSHPPGIETLSTDTEFLAYLDTCKQLPGYKA
jgi:hypothetical protein